MFAVETNYLNLANKACHSCSFHKATPLLNLMPFLRLQIMDLSVSLSFIIIVLTFYKMKNSVSERCLSLNAFGLQHSYNF